MRRLLIAVAAVLALGAPPALAAPAFPLEGSGRWLVDAQGRTVILHGVNMVAKRPPYAPDALGFGADDARFLAANGFNTVRLGVIYAAVEPQPGIYDDAYLDRIERTVDQLGREGIAVLLDFHQDLYSERFQGEGWPDWAVIDDGLPAEPRNGFPANYVGMPALNRAFDRFWENAPGPGGVGLQDRYAAAWRHVAARFGDHPAMLGYDVLNEPWPGSAWQSCAQADGCPAFDAVLGAFYDRVTAAIRTVDPTTLVFYSPNVLGNAGVRSHLPARADRHTALSFHDYCAADLETCRPIDDQVFRFAAGLAARSDDPLLLTEFGATDDAAVLDDMADRADRFMVGWQEWHYCGCDDPTTTGPGDEQALVLDPARPPRGANLKQPTLDTLARAYPQVVAGTPIAYGFDRATRRMTLRYRPARGVTEIATPRRQYPRGYRVTVRGARVRSRANANVLRLVARPRAREVRVSVTPRRR
ncbi:MAG TPA: cellulase family glycosylhydrolase [Capillimicrobium sp.]|nr:cellulase family glycosylhydrolase [Capillimicrobium sp.]